MAKFVKGRVEFERQASQGKFAYVKGTSKWAQILEPDNYGNFSVNLYGDYVEELKTSLEVMLNSAYDEVIEAGKVANKVDSVFKQDQEGNNFIGFKLPATNQKGEDNKIEMYDVTGKPVENWDKLVGNGSTVKVKYRVAPYYMASTKQVGLSFRFYAMQVIELVQYNEADSGFGDETGGSTGFGNETLDNNADF